MILSRKTNWTLRIGILLVGILVLPAMGCGGSAHKVGEDPANAGTPPLTTDRPGAQTKIGSELKLKILPGRSDHPELPDFEAKPVVSTEPYVNDQGAYSPVRDKQVIISGNQISFQEVIPLFEGGKERKLYLVWDENALGTRIINAFHTHQEEGPLHEKEYTVHEVAANVDSVQHAFFVPLLEAIDREAIDVDSSSVHTITLAFTFDTRSRVEVNIQLRLLGTMPKFAPKAGTPADALQLPPEQFSRLASLGKIPVRRLILENPARRSFLIWLQAESGFVLDTVFTRPHFADHPQSPPTSSPQNASSRARLEIKEVWIQRKNAPAEDGEKEVSSTEKLVLTRDHLTALTIGPEETLTIDWIAAAAPGTMNCILPAADSRNLGWSTPHMEWVEGRTSGGHDGGGVIETQRQTGWDPHSIVVSERWSYLAARVLGHGRFMTLLTDSFVRAEDLEPLQGDHGETNARRRLIAERTVNLDTEGSASLQAPAAQAALPVVLSVGPPDPRIDIDFPCQGVFAQAAGPT